MRFFFYLDLQSRCIHFESRPDGRSVKNFSGCNCDSDTSISRWNTTQVIFHSVYYFNLRTYYKNVYKLTYSYFSSYRRGCSLQNCKYNTTYEGDYENVNNNSNDTTSKANSKTARQQAVTGNVRKRLGFKSFNCKLQNKKSGSLLLRILKEKLP